MSEQLDMHNGKVGTWAQGDAVFYENTTGVQACIRYRKDMRQASIGISTHSFVDALLYRNAHTRIRELESALQTFINRVSAYQDPGYENRHYYHDAERLRKATEDASAVLNHTQEVATAHTTAEAAAEGDRQSASRVA